MWVTTLNMDSIIDLSAMERISVIRKVGEGYVIMAYPVGIDNAGFVIREFHTKSEAKECMMELMGKLNMGYVIL